MEPDAATAWMLKNRVLASGRLLTAALTAQKAVAELHQLIGYLDGRAPEASYLEQGMNVVRSRLLRVVTALDMGSAK